MSSVQTGHSAASPPIPATRPQARPQSDSYTVKSGDSLWNIAKEKYGDGMKWKDIYADNKAVIGNNPDLIHPGMQLQLRGLAPAVAPVAEAPQPEVEAPAEAPTEENAVAEVPGGSATPTVDLFAEEDPAPTQTAPVQAHPELVEEPAQAPAVDATAPEAPTTPAAETETPVVVEEEPTPEPAAKPEPAAEPAPAQAPAVDTTVPEAPAMPATETEAPAAVAAVEPPDQVATPAAPPAAPEVAAADVAPAVDTTPPNPELDRAEALLSTIDGKGYTVSHHGDPVGGIPKVARAMDEVLAMSASGDLEKLPEGATRDKMNQWAQDIVSGRLAQAARQFDGVTESATQKVNALLDHPAFKALPAENQERLLNGLRSGFEMMGYLPAERRSEVAQQLHTRLSEHFGVAEAAPAAEPAPAQAPAVDTTVPEAPATPATEAEAPAAVAAAESPAQPATPAAPPAAPEVAAAEAAPTVDTTPANPELDRAVALLNTIDGKGYTVSHHGDPVGGIPKVARAMDEVLAMSASGDLEKLPEGATRDKMNQWAQDIVSGRLAQAARQFDGVTESATQKVNALLDHPAFEALPAENQERLLNGLRSGFDMMGYLPAERRSESAQQLHTRLGEHFGVAEVAPAQEPTPEQPAAAQAPAVDTTAPEAPAMPAVETEEAPAAVATAESPAQPATPAAPPVAPEVAAAEAAPIVDTTPANPELDRAVALLSTIDGKGYTVSHHGDPVGGIPKVARAMDEVLAMSASGDLEKLPEGATRDKMNQWAQDIVSGRLAQAARQFDGVTESATQKVNALLDHPAFESLPAENQERLLNGLRSGFEMMGYLPAERRSEAAQQLHTRLGEHFGVAEAAPTETAEAPASAVTLTPTDLQNTLQEDVGFFGKGAHQEKLKAQGLAIAAQGPEQRQLVSQLLSDAQAYGVLSEVLAKSDPQGIAEVLTHSDIRGLRVIEAAEDEVAGQFLTALAAHKDHVVGAEDLIASTLDAFDGTFKDREKPFEILAEQQAYARLSEQLQEKIQELLKYW